MQYGFIKAVAATPEIRVADCPYNAEQIIGVIKQAVERGTKLLCLPELCITGYTCSDLFLQSSLQNAAVAALGQIARASAQDDVVIVVGLPYVHKAKLYNCAAVLHRGKVLGLVPKTYLPTYGEYYERRQFTPAPEKTVMVSLLNQQVPFGTKLLFRCQNLPDFCLGVEICEDLWAPRTPGSAHATAGATVLANASAGDEIVGKAEYRRELVSSASGRLICGYLYACAGKGESTTDMVFSAHNMVGENGVILAEAPPFASGWAESELDVERLAAERCKNTSFRAQDEGYLTVDFAMDLSDTPLTRIFPQTPFVPADDRDRAARCELILTMQAAGLAKRVQHIGCKTVVVGISGGLDSCLALLVAARAFRTLERPLTEILAVTMPCFGTSERTRTNAELLCRELGVTFREVPIQETVKSHFRDIGQAEGEYDVTYENGQARMRTMVLMDLANMTDGIVVGTGDLSELALGWATYNGDHMSMYGVNAGVPKTLVRHLVAHCADTADNPALTDCLKSILDTPVSPELLPITESGEISQVTEDLVGPYELHDFYLYYILRFGFGPKKVYYMARYSFAEKYSDEELLRWLKNFYTRFFRHQFKRSCLPDGPKIGSVTLSPRGDWRMPSDASADVWQRELKEL